MECVGGRVRRIDVDLAADHRKAAVGSDGKRVRVERARQALLAGARRHADAVHVEEARPAGEEPGVVRSLHRSGVVEGEEERFRIALPADGGLMGLGTSLK